MTRTVATDVLFFVFAGIAVVSAWRVFRTDSMVRAAYFLLASFAGVAGIMLLLGAPFLGLVLLLMMGGEMTIMAVFMVMFMMNPAGLNPMTMVHQHRASIAAGVFSFAALGFVAVTAAFPDRAATDVGDPTAALGRELLGNSMLLFQTAGFTLLATMIGSIAIAAGRGRFGDAYDATQPPAIDVEETVTAMSTDVAGEADAGHEAHE